MATVLAVCASILVGATIKYNKLAPIYKPGPGSLNGKTIVITGANTGLGLASAKRLAASGAKVVVTVRSDAKGQTTVQEIQDYVLQETGKDALATYKVLSLDSVSGIKEAVDKWTDLPNIDVLLNNAGLIGGPTRALPQDGMEISFQTNHLGPFLLTGLLKDKLSDTARIVNVASEAYYMMARPKLDFEYMWEPDVTQYGFFYSYAQSKLANILFTQELQRRANAAGKHWIVSACHPGAVATELGRSHGQPMLKQIQEQFLALIMRSPAQGATTQVWLAAGADGSKSDVSGEYLADRTVQRLYAYAKDEQTAAQLWSESEERAGCTFSF